MSLLLCIDPGLRVCGVALFEISFFPDGRLNTTASSGGRLYKAWAAKAPGKERGAVAWRAMASQIYKDVCNRVEMPMHLDAGQYLRSGAISHLLIEEPQVYQGAKAKGDPDDLIQLAGVCGSIEGRFSNVSNVQSMKPAEWKKQVDGDVMTSRILARLLPEELARIEKSPRAKNVDHNAVDACGLGLRFLNRLG